MTKKTANETFIPIQSLAKLNATSRAGSGSENSARCLGDSKIVKDDWTRLLRILRVGWDEGVLDSFSDTNTTKAFNTCRKTIKIPVKKSQTWNKVVDTRTEMQATLRNDLNNENKHNQPNGNCSLLAGSPIEWRAVTIRGLMTSTFRC